MVEPASPQQIQESFQQIQSLREGFGSLVQEAIRNGSTDQAKQARAKLQSQITEFMYLIDPYELRLRKKLAEREQCSFVDAFGVEGLARAKTKEGGRWTFIDREGNQRGDYDYVYSYSDGRALVGIFTNPSTARTFGWSTLNTDKAYMFIDKNGQQVGGTFEDARPFSEGYACVKQGNQWWHYIGIDGQKVNFPTYSDSWQLFADFTEGVAWRGESSTTFENLYVLIDKQGNQILEKRGDLVDKFSQGLAAIKKTGGSFCYIDINGQEIVSGGFDLAYPFSEDIALVAREKENSLPTPSRTSSWPPPNIPTTPFTTPTYHDYTRTVTPTYTELPPTPTPMLISPSTLPRPSSTPTATATPTPIFYEYFFIDKTGQKIIADTFIDAKSFSEGVAPVKVGGLWQFIDRTGTRVVPGFYDYAECFSGGVAEVRQHSKTFYIDKKGRKVFS